MRVAYLAVVAVLFVPRDGEACSCMSPPAVLVTPDRHDEAPLNTRVRVEVPAFSTIPAVVLRVHDGAEVATTTRTTKGGWLAGVELTPKQPLAAGTRYEVAYVDEKRHPSSIVFGTFVTGATTDTTAPHFDTLGGAVAHKYGLQSGGGVIVMSSCATSDPWITVDGLSASDRQGAQIAWAVWRADANGTIDDTKPPAATLLANDKGILTLGRTSTCDPHTFALPDKGIVTLGLAALDEAGNKSATKKLRVDMAAAVP